MRLLCQEPGRADMRIVERLLRRIDLGGDDARRLECDERLGAAARGCTRRSSGRR